MLRKTMLLFAGLCLAGSALGQELVVNGSFENGLTGWTQDRVEAAGTFESVPNGGSHSFAIGCVAPAGFPGSGNFWAVSCQGDPDVHVLYQDVTIPAAGASLSLAAGVEMCAVPGGACGPPGAKSAGFDESDAGKPAAVPGTGLRFLGAEKGGGCTSTDDCALLDIVDAAADVLDPTAGVLLPMGDAVNQDFDVDFGTFDLSGFAGQTIRIRLWVQANNAAVALQVDSVSLLGRSPIPTLQPIGLGALLLLVGTAGALIIRRRRRRG